MLCVEDYLDTLKWGASIGGLAELQRRCDENAQTIYDWVAKTAWVEVLAKDKAAWSNTGVCLKFADPRVARLPDAAQKDFAARLYGRLEKEGVALDCNAYRDAPGGLRIWCGATIEHADIEALIPWLDWAFAEDRRRTGRSGLILKASPPRGGRGWSGGVAAERLEGL